jgi:SAM-dependent methyltransferase
MSVQTHWDRIYQTKSPLETSWHEPHLATSLEWIMHAAPDPDAAIVDVGGGESTLVDDLLGHGYRAVSVLDISEAALTKSQRRLEKAARQVKWIVGDVTGVALPPHTYDLWHDRAVFHFLVETEQRAAYVRKLTASLKDGGQVIVATFGPEGPQNCSGLPTRRYDAEALSREFGPEFRVVRHGTVMHQTPFGTMQQFLYCQLALSPK